MSWLEGKLTRPAKPVPLGIGDEGATVTAVACPPFATSSCSVKLCPTLTCAGVKASAVEVSDGGVWMASGPEGEAVAMATVAPLFASVPDPAMDTETAPARAAVQLQEKVRLAPPGTSCGAGRDTSVSPPEPVSAGVRGVNCRVVAWPALLTLSTSVTSWPRLACPGETPAAAVSDGGVWMLSAFELALADSGAPVMASLPAAGSPNETMPAAEAW